MANPKKSKENKRDIQKKVYVSKHDIEAVGGEIAMSNILRNARNKAVAELCGCEICQSGKNCEA